MCQQVSAGSRQFVRHEGVEDSACQNALDRLTLHGHVTGVKSVERPLRPELRLDDTEQEDDAAPCRHTALRRFEANISATFSLPDGARAVIETALGERRKVQFRWTTVKGPSGRPSAAVSSAVRANCGNHAHADESTDDAGYGRARAPLPSPIQGRLRKFHVRPRVAGTTRRPSDMSHRSPRGHIGINARAPESCVWRRAKWLMNDPPRRPAPSDHAL
jgi:hypothetical protein